MNTRDLEAFVAVVETGSIIAASARLNLTSPGVTRRVQSLESLLGTALLDRQTKPLKPTAAGREAYEHGRRVLKGVAELKSEVAPGGEVRGELRLGLTPYLSEAALAGPIDVLRARFPALSLRLTTGWSPDLVAKVMRSELDGAAIGLVDGEAPPDGLAAENLGSEHVLLVAAESLDLPRPATLADLARHPWIINQDGCGFRTAIRQRFEAARLPFTVGVEVPSAELRLSLVARGHGIGVVTPAALEASPWRGDVHILEAPDLAPQVHAWLVHRPPAGRLAGALDAFARELALTRRQGTIRSD